MTAKSKANQQSVDLPCPNCGKKTSKTLGWLEDHDTFPCPACSTDITVSREQVRRIRDELAKLSKAASRKLGLKIRF